MILDKILSSDLTLTLAPSEIKYIQILANLSTCLLSATIDSGGAYSVQATLNSTEFLENATYETSTWENIKVAGVEYSELAFSISSLLFNSPNVLRFKNTSTGSQNLTISLRGNR